MRTPGRTRRDSILCRPKLSQPHFATVRVGPPFGLCSRVRPVKTRGASDEIDPEPPENGPAQPAPHRSSERARERAHERAPISGQTTPVLAVAELSVDRPSAATADGLDMVLVKGDFGIRAYDARCPHRGTLLSEGHIEGTEIVCRAHGYRFAADTGTRCHPPSKHPGPTSDENLCPIPCAIEGDQVVIAHDGIRSANIRAKTPPFAAPRSLADLPGPPHWPLIGNLPDLEPTRFHAILERWAEEFGEMYTYRFGPKRTLVLSSASAIEGLLRARPTKYRRVSRIESIFRDLGVLGVFSAEGEPWRAQRRLAMEALSQKHLHVFYPTLQRVAGRLLDRWRIKETTFASAAPDETAPWASPAPTPFVGAVPPPHRRRAQIATDLTDDLTRFTVDVTTSLAFSVDMNTLERGEDVIQQHLQLIFPAISRRLVTPIPYWRYIKTPNDRALDAALVEVRQVLDALIASAKERLAMRTSDDHEGPRDFLEAMLLARDENGEPFSSDIIFGNTLTMLLAGEDTTAHTLAWIVHLVCDQETVVQRLQAEVDEVMGDARVPTLPMLKKLRYVDAVAQEAMRLRPVAPLLLHEALEDSIIDGVRIPKGTTIATLLRRPSLDRNNFALPEIFAPERWLGEGPAKTAHDPNVHFPFGSGPRICPGRSLALLEIHLITAMLFRNFEVERIGDASRVREHFAFTMMPRSLEVALRSRHPAPGATQS